jgi:hypothetical protein
MAPEWGGWVGVHRPPTPSTVAESTYTGGGMRTDHPIA